MRLFTASIYTETNTFSSLPTGLESYKECVFLRPGEHPQESPICPVLWVARKRAAAEGFILIEGSCFAAEPAGITSRGDYEFMRDEILGQLKAALPLDGVVLGLHGAMVAHGYEDVEGDILERARALVGSECIIGVELDPHCHLTVKRVKLADVIVLYKEYPHTDTVERAEDVLDIVLRALRREVKPVMSLYDCRQIQMYPTTLPLMRAFVDRTMTMEGREGVLSISIAHCFPYADVPELSARILIVMDKDKTKGDTLAKRLGEEFVWMRGKTEPPNYSIDEGINAALECKDAPVVIADAADNAGCGAPSDNTNIVRRLIERRVENAAVGPIWDPIAVRLCFEAGDLTQFALRFGGKVGPTSGMPIDATVTVVGLKRDCRQSSPFGPTILGDCAAVRVGGVNVVLVSKRVQAYGLELFTNVGIDPLAQKMVVVKSTSHFSVAYGPIAKKILYIDCGGALSRDYRKILYTRVARPIWPLDEETSPGLIL
ncbi:microcystin LR degradation protein MlrC-like protein [Bradyrhizobium canariense]|uniref:Microcystinase C n=1 Tax=Bradyrhizobium canariense TaxID=255045 RepID=A0ABX3XAE4_9BRAD|nr:M81 family metallopeptidase [Bradyrhizobium canariense]OSJ19442.1 microcystin LR degradation protein MlrC-like protein [Bradyrhizobium canariense]OSJ34898.1 microcystin LR degradation protein MlrC-like protein [Bradyrhizobium canariense]